MADLGLALRPGPDRSEAIAALSGVTGLSPVDPAALLDGGLRRRGRRGFFPARAVRAAHTFDAADRRDEAWWPQGISWPDGRSDDGVVGLTWYHKHDDGCRVTFYDVRRHRYEHALVVVPSLADDGTPVLKPLTVHAGGLVWTRGLLHVAATTKGFHTARLEDLLQVDDPASPPRGVHTAGHRYLLPVHHSWRPETADGTEALRYSFFSVDRTGSAPHLLVGEYGRGKQSRRLAWFGWDDAAGTPAVGADGAARAVRVETGVRQMQGAVAHGGRVLATSSRGARTPGSLYAGDGPGSLAERGWATPMGPEDLDVDADGHLWTVTEHPRRRWVVRLRG